MALDASQSAPRKPRTIATTITTLSMRRLPYSLTTRPCITTTRTDTFVIPLTRQLSNGQPLGRNTDVQLTSFLTTLLKRTGLWLTRNLKTTKKTPSTMLTFSKQMTTSIPTVMTSQSGTLTTATRSGTRSIMTRHCVIVRSSSSVATMMCMRRLPTLPGSMTRRVSYTSILKGQ